MKLYGSLTSPFVRKLRVAVQEFGLAERVELVVTDPWSSPPALLANNPLSKVPTLVTDDGLALPDSALILDYLIDLSGYPALPSGRARWEAARLVQIADGVLDAAVAIVIEKRRPPPFIYPGWLDRQTVAISRALDALESAATQLSTGAAGLVEVTLGPALAYVDFRMPDYDWRTSRPALAAWYAQFAQRPSMQTTQPPPA